MKNAVEKEKDLFPKSLPLLIGGAEVDLVRCPHLLIHSKEDLSAVITDLCRQLTQHDDGRHFRTLLSDPERSVIPNISRGETNLITGKISGMPHSGQILRWVLKDIDGRYKKLRDAKARDILTFNRKKEQEWVDHLYSTIHPEYLGDLSVIMDKTSGLQKKMHRRIVVIANLEIALSAESNSLEKIQRIVEIGRTAGVHVIAATTDIESLSAELTNKFTAQEILQTRLSGL